MIPGKEMDAAVAKQVFKWTPFKKKWQDGEHGGFHDRWLDKDGFELDNKDTPSFSTEFYSAWKVVSLLISPALGLVFRMNYKGGRWEVEFESTFDKRVYMGCGSTEAEAVCQAALVIFKEKKNGN